MELHWDNKFEIGIERIDFEHRIFLDLIITFHELIIDRTYDKNKASRLLKEIHKYADFHFTSEENIMIDIAYPELESHREAHQQLLMKLKDQILDLENGHSQASDFFDFIFNWFAIHTTTEDKKIATYISQNSKL